jgi:hypothetical protein
VTVDASQNTTLAGTLTTSSRGIAKASMPAGTVLQVINATDATGRSTISTSFVTASNTLSVTITPSSASNKILILVSSALYSPSDSEMYVTIYRGATNLGSSNGLAITRDGVVNAMCNAGINYLDSPATTSATTYQVYFRNTDSTNSTLNRSGVKGSITCLEIKG